MSLTDTFAARKKAAGNAVRAVINGIKAEPDDAKAEFMTMCATTAISTMHGTLGKQFTREYLEAALDSLDDPNTEFLMEGPIQ